MPQPRNVKRPRPVYPPRPVDYPRYRLEKRPGRQQQPRHGDNRQRAPLPHNLVNVILDKPRRTRQIPQDELQKGFLQHLRIRHPIRNDHNPQNAGKQRKNGVVGNPRRHVIRIPGQHLPGNANQHNHRPVMQERQIGNPLPQRRRMPGGRLPRLNHQLPIAPRTNLPNYHSRPFSLLPVNVNLLPPCPAPAKTTPAP